MSENVLVFSVSLLFFFGYWTSYVLIRSGVSGWNKYGKMLFINMLSAVIFFTFAGIYLVGHFEINNVVFWINLLLLNCGVIVHHVSVIDRKHFPPKIHHQISHLLFFIPFTLLNIIGLTCLYSQNFTSIEFNLWLVLSLLALISGISGIIVGVGLFKLPWL